MKGVGLKRATALALAAVMLLLACALGEGLEIEPEPVDDLPLEMAGIQLSANGAVANDGAGYTPAFETVTIDGAGKSLSRGMKVGDTCRFRVSGATLLDCTASKASAVAIGGVQADAEGAYVDVRAEAACKKMNLSFKLSGSKNKKFTVSLTITDPFEADAIAFNASMPRSVPVGATIDLNDMVSLTPAYAAKNLNWKSTGAGKVSKDGVLTTTKAGKANITVTSRTNKKVKATYSLEVLANKLQNLSSKPTASSYAPIAGSWTLWPVSVEAKKGNLQCVFYALNATGDNGSQIEGLEIEVAAGLWRNVIARGSFQKVKANAGNNKYKQLKLNVPIVGDMSGVFLPEQYNAGRLYIRVNADAVTLKTKKGSFPYTPTRLPAQGGFLVERIELSQLQAVLSENGTATLTAAVLPANAEITALEWVSSDPAVVTVEAGTLTGRGHGTATVSAVATDGSGTRAECAVIVSSTGGFLLSNGVVQGYYGKAALVEVPSKDEDGNPIVAIAEGAFRGNTSVASVTLPSTVKDIGPYAFEGCTSLKTVKLPNGASNFQKGAFKDCPALERMTTF